MTRASGKHHRRSLRLQGYDYSQPGAYFVTICTQNNAYLFGDIVDGEMLLNDAGQMVRAVWNELARNYPGIGIDTFVIMPNHIHGIITIHSPAVGAGPRTCPSLRARRGHRPASGHHPPPGNHRGLPLR